MNLDQIKGRNTDLYEKAKLRKEFLKSFEESQEK